MSIGAFIVPKNLGRGFPRMVRGFSRIAIWSVEANTRGPNEEVYPRKFAFDPRKSASRLSRAFT